MSELDDLCQTLRNGEYEGEHIMQAWIAIESLQQRNAELEAKNAVIVTAWDELMADTPDTDCYGNVTVQAIDYDAFSKCISYYAQSLTSKEGE